MSWAYCSTRPPSRTCSCDPVLAVDLEGLLAGQVPGEQAEAAHEEDQGAGHEQGQVPAHAAPRHAAHATHPPSVRALLRRDMPCTTPLTCR